MSARFRTFYIITLFTPLQDRFFCFCIGCTIRKGANAMESYEFYLKPAAGENIQVAVPLPGTRDAVISGIVTQESGPVSAALVLLMDQGRRVLGYTVTDELGQFYFGPLPGDTLYLLRVQQENGTVRLVELS
jgi:hypothetical protein